MVNVPGRSTGCHTCRKRKVKCDEARPTCRKCGRVGRTCLGYAKVTHFVNASAVLTLPATEGKGASCDRRTLLEVQKCSVTAIEALQVEKISLIAFKSDICTAFLFTNHVWYTYGTPWLELAAKGRLNENLAIKTCQALAYYNFGKLHHQKNIEVEGFAYYGQALRDLASRLPDAGLRLEELLVPVLLMLLCANAAGDIPGAISHIQGLNKLLQVCDPASFTAEPYRSAFDSCRATIITMHLILRKRTFLEQEKWRTWPWRSDPISKGHQSCVSDVLVMIPGLLEDLDAYFSNSSSRSQSDIASRIYGEVKNLFAWRWLWEEENRDKIRNIPDSASTSKTRLKCGIHEPTILFEREMQCIEIMLYNAALLWLLNLVWKLTPSSATKIIKDAAVQKGLGAWTKSPLLRPGEVCTLRGPAIEICHCYEGLILRDRQYRDRALFYMFPLALAGTVLVGDERYSRWIRSMIDFSPVTSGYGQDSSNAYGFRFYLTSQAVT